MDIDKPHYIVIQPYSRNPQFYNLAEWRMKDILQNHYQTIEKHQKKLKVETIYSLGMAENDFIQITRFAPEDTLLFHELMNDLTKINAPFMEFREPFMGVSKIGDYWLEQLKDIDLKKMPMSKFSRSRWGIKS